MHPPTTALEVTPADSRKDRAAFLEFPYQLHRGERMWVPPLRSEQRRLLDRRNHPFYDFGRVQPFLARQNGRVVGRVAAVRDTRSERYGEAGRGFFGLFDCIDSSPVAEALFGSVTDWLRGHGLKSVLGPVNFSTNYECGLLTEGFDQQPAVQMPYNPVYYPGLMAACEFRTAMELLAWEIPIQAHENEDIMRLVRHVQRHSGARVRPLNLRDFDGDAKQLMKMYHRAWERNWGFVAMTDREFEYMVRQWRWLVEPEMCLIAEVDGVPVGFGLALPDLSPALAAANGRLHTCGIPLGLVRLLRARRCLGRVRVVALGVLEEYRNRGIELLLLAEGSRAAQQMGYHSAEASWILADNDRANRRMPMGGGRISKRYQLYERPL